MMRRGCGLWRKKDVARAAKSERLEGEDGQMTVELALVFPVIIVVAAMAVNALLFFSECASFDRMAHNAIRVLATSPSLDEQPTTLASQIEATVREETGMEEVTCTVSGSSAGIKTYQISCSFAPTLFGMGLRSEIWGVPLPKLMHATQFAVDAWDMRSEVEGG